MLGDARGDPGDTARPEEQRQPHARVPEASVSEAEDFSQPILEGTARSDYERYLLTDELLALQKTPDEWVHRDELLFQTVHQSSELWLKLAWNEVEEASELVQAGDVAAALRLLRRPALCLRFITAQLDMLEQMSPWEYQEVRKVLGHGSGFDSPGFRELRRALPRLGEAFHAAREQAGLTLVDVYVHGREHEELYQLAEALVELDEWTQTWRIRHYRVVARIIGDAVVGTQGTPVEVLGRLIHKLAFPELWEVRNELTALSKTSG
jgi:tryptophan 2,3-dioxygenase